jgi:DNA mismatch repair protein MutS2
LIGALKVNVPVNSLALAEKPKESRAARPNLRLQKAFTAVTEIHLRSMRAEEAIRDLEKFIDDAVLASVPSIRIVHGKGEGILRKLVHDFLRRSANVGSYRLGEPSEGGDGVTIAVFK